MNGSSLRSLVIPAHTNNYTKGRQGKKVVAITPHHTAGVISAQSLGKNVWQNPNRKGSSHYGIGNAGEIAQYVDERDTAWTNSNWNSNTKSITIEVSNSSTGGQWLVSDKALNSLIRLMADISKRYGLHPLELRKNVTLHEFFTSTNCPGPYLKGKMDYIIKEANKLNSSLKVEKITPKKIILNKDTFLWSFVASNWNEIKSVKAYAKDTIIEVVDIVTNNLGGKYYRTQYSAENGIYNGFNIIDCEDYVEPKPKEEPTAPKEPIVEPKPTEPIEDIKEEEKELETAPNELKQVFEFKVPKTGLYYINMNKGEELRIYERNYPNNDK